MTIEIGEAQVESFIGRFFDETAEHAGVKGMKWGVRKEEYKSMGGKDKRDARRTFKLEKSKAKGQKVIDKYDGDSDKAFNRTALKGLGAGVAVYSATLAVSKLPVRPEIKIAANIAGTIVNGVIGQKTGSQLRGINDVDYAEWVNED